MNLNELLKLQPKSRRPRARGGGLGKKGGGGEERREEEEKERGLTEQLGQPTVYIVPWIFLVQGKPFYCRARTRWGENRSLCGALSTEITRRSSAKFSGVVGLLPSGRRPCMTLRFFSAASAICDGVLARRAFLSARNKRPYGNTTPLMNERISSSLAPSLGSTTLPLELQSTKTGGGTTLLRFSPYSGGARR